MKVSVAFQFIIVSMAVAALAGEPEKPYKEMPDVLFYENFEHAGTVCEKGKLANDEIVPPGQHCWELDKAKEENLLHVQLAKAQVKIPQGINPNTIYIHASFYSDAMGAITFTFQPGAVASPIMHLPKLKTWSSVMVRLAEFKANKKPFQDVNASFGTLEIHVKPPKGKDAGKVYVDNIIIATNPITDDMKARLVVAEQKRLDFEKQFERDGFSYTYRIQEYLKKSFKTVKVQKTPKSVLVFGSTPELTKTWIGNLEESKTKVKDTAYTFIAADAPEPCSKFKGVSDMRMLLPYNLGKVPDKVPEMVLLVLSAGDALAAGRPAELLKVCVQRIKEAGSIPVLVVPGANAATESGKIDAFAKQISEYGTEWAAPVIDGRRAVANDKGAFDPALAGPKSIEKAALLAMTALKHCHDMMAKD